MIRPRIGDFLYSKDELAVMLEDIRVFKDLGNIRGFVVGVLTKDGRVNVELMKMCVSAFFDRIL
jgi:copper homeostasis protein